MTTTKSGHPACTRCHRALKDPVSVQAGLGPVCRRKLGVAEPAEGGMLPEDRGPAPRGAAARHGTRSAWTYTLAEGFVLVEDLDRGMSVTNDAEAVVAALAKEAPLAGRRILYRDSEGRWDEIVHGDGPVWFKAIGGTSAEDAIRRATDRAELEARALAGELSARHLHGDGVVPPPGFEVVDRNAFPGDPFLDGTVELRPAKKSGDKPTSDL
jgi:hypothetical protein